MLIFNYITVQKYFGSWKLKSEEQCKTVRVDG